MPISEVEEEVATYTKLLRKLKKCLLGIKDFISYT